MGIAPLGKVLKASGLEISKLKRYDLFKDNYRVFFATFKNGEKGICTINNFGQRHALEVISEKGASVTHVLEKKSENGMSVLSNGDIVIIPQTKSSTLVRGNNNDVYYSEIGISTPVSTISYKDDAGEVRDKICGKTIDSHVDKYFRTESGKKILIVRDDEFVSGSGQSMPIFKKRPNILTNGIFEKPLRGIWNDKDGYTFVLTGNETVQQVNKILGTQYKSPFNLDKYI